MISIKLNRLLLSVMVLFATIGTILLVTPKQASAAYNGARIIDNGIFLNASSMSAAQIQSFLISKGSGLASRSFVMQCSAAGSTANQMYISVGAPCNQNTSAANIIFYSSRIYGVNPQVILATIQKEQSLVTTGNPTVWQLTQAMGYACPTSGSCDTSSSFFYQIDNGTWVLRYHYERANRNNTWWNNASWAESGCSVDTKYRKPSAYPGQNVRFYDENNVHYRTYFIENAATSAFYCYTPHAYNNPQGLYGRAPYGNTGMYYSGSYNFVTAFEEWFGRTSGTPLLQGTTSTVYLATNNGVRYGVPSSEMLYNYRLLSAGVTPASDSYIGSLVDGGVLKSLFSVSGDPTVYIADGGRKIGIPSGAMCTAYGFDCSAGGISEVSSDIANGLADGGVLQPLMAYNNTVYKMQNGVRKPYLSAQAVAEDGMNLNQVTVMTSGYNLGRSVGAPIIENRTLVRFPASPTVYYHNGGNFYAIPDGNTFNNWFAGASVNFDQVSSYAGGPPSTAGTLYSIFRTSGGNTFVLNNGGRIDVSSVASDWPTPLVLSSLDSIATAKPLVATASTNSTYRTEDSALSRVSGGSRMIFPSMNDFYALGYSLSNLININKQTMDLLSAGPYSIGEGSVFKINSDPTSIYLKGPSNSIYYLTSQNQLGQFQLTRVNPVMPATQLQQYTTPKALVSFVSVTGGSTYMAVVDEMNRMWVFDATSQNAWGINPSNAVSISETGPIFAGIKKTNTRLPVFASYNGTVYYANNGVKHPIATYQSYVNLGGNANNTFPATKDFIDAAPTGSIL